MSLASEELSSALEDPSILDSLSVDWGSLRWSLWWSLSWSLCPPQQEDQTPLGRALRWRRCPAWGSLRTRSW